MDAQNFTINIYTANTKKTKKYTRKISDIITLGTQIEEQISYSILEAHNIFNEEFMKNYYVKFVNGNDSKIFILYKKNGLRENDTVIAFGQLLTEGEVEILNQNELAKETYGTMPNGPCLRIEFLLHNLLEEQSKYKDGDYGKQLDKIITASTLYYMFKEFFSEDKKEEKSHEADLYFTLYNKMTHTEEIEKFLDLYSVVITDIESSLNESEIDLFQLFPNKDFENLFIRINHETEDKDSFYTVKREYDKEEEIIIYGEMYHTKEALNEYHMKNIDQFDNIQNTPCLILNGDKNKISTDICYFILCSYLSTLLGFYFILEREKKNSYFFN